MSVSHRWFLLFVLILVGVAARGETLNPRTTTLPTYLLPKTAAVDGRLDEWAAIPPSVTSEQFHSIAINGKSSVQAGEYAVTVRCGMKKQSPDLYLLVTVRDPHRYVEAGKYWVSGDYLELYFDFGRAARDRDWPTWADKQDNVSNPREMGQYGLRPLTLQEQATCYRTPHTAQWILDYVSQPIDQGYAYEIRLDGASVLKDLGLPALPAYLGLEFGLQNLDYPLSLITEGWANTANTYRLYGNGMEHAWPVRYGMLSTRPMPAPAGMKPTLPATLKARFGGFPTAGQVKKALPKLAGDQLADLVYWSGLQGGVLDAGLATQLMASPSPLVRENTLAVLLFSDQPKESCRQAVAAAFTARESSAQELTLACLITAQQGLDFRAPLGTLLLHENPTVAVAAARALAKSGAADAVPVFTQALASRQQTPAAGIPAFVYKIFMVPLLDELVAVTEPLPMPSQVTRQVLAQNTDLPRLFPSDGNTVYNGTGLLRRWPAGGPKELWRVEVGQGKSGVVEADGRAFTAAQTPKQQWAICLDPNTGATLWKCPLVDRESHHVVDGPTVTPLVDGDRVYFIAGGNYQDGFSYVYCLSAKDGTEIWSEKQAYCGAEGATPLIVGDVLYLGTIATAHPYVAVNKFTGKVVWQSAPARGEAATGASPTYTELDGIPLLIYSAGEHGACDVFGVNAKTGEVYWTIPFNLHNGLISSPVIAGPYVFISGGQGTASFSAVLRLYVRDGKIKMRQLYRDATHQTNMYHTVSIVDQVVYGFTGGFGNGAIEATSLVDGKVLWQHTGKEWGSDRQLIIADGLIFALTDKQLVLLDANTTGYKELGRVAINADMGDNLQQPTLANGRLYLRGEKWVICYDVAIAR